MGHRTGDEIAARERIRRVPDLERIPRGELLVVFNHLLRRHLRFGGEGDVEERAVAHGPRGVEGFNRAVSVLDKAGDVPRIVVADEMPRSGLCKRPDEPFGASLRLRPGGRAFDGGEFAPGERGNARTILRHRLPTRPGGRCIGIDVAGKSREPHGNRADEAVVAVEKRTHDGVVPRIVIGRGEARRNHDGERVDHRHRAEDENGVDEREKSPCLDRPPLALEDYRHRV